MASKILLTGRPGVGKTALVRKILGCGIPIAGGFVTEEIREGGQRGGFRVEDVHTGEQGILAHSSRRGSPRVGKYGVDVASFDRIGVEAVRKAMHRDGCIVIDEIGKMEMHSKAFRDLIVSVMDSDLAVLATIPVHQHPLLDGLRQRKDVILIEVTYENRDALPQRLVEMLVHSDKATP